jgi:hypothetical protein
MPVTLQYLKNEEINFDKWDCCIDNADNGLLYGYSFYLNEMCTAWDAIVLNDYEAIMPLPLRKKLAIYYLYQPFLTAQLGLFGKDISAALLESFLKEIPKKFRYWDFPLNYRNVFLLKEFPLYQRKNFVFPLNKPYSELYAGYRETTKRNIKKSGNFVSSVSKEIPVDDVIRFNRQQANAKQQKNSDEDYNRFQNLFNLLHAQGKAVVYGAFSKKVELLAGAVFFYYRNRAYYILVGNSPESKTTGASHYLIATFIQDHAGQNVVLDFEGSDIKSLSFFYSSFGAVEENYAAIRYNNLPPYVKWLKK